MKNILFINACLRDNSRTLKLAKEVLNNLEGKVCEVDLYTEDIKPLDNDMLNLRDKSFSENDFSDDYFRYVKQFKDADEIVIAAPYWDLSFPSVLKIYLENICINGVSFKYSEDGIPVGLCKAKRLIYVASAGGFIPKDNYAFNYVESLAKDFFGIKDTLFIKAEGLDIDGSNVELIIDDVIKNIKKII